MAEERMVSFKLPEETVEGLKILATLSEQTQTEVIKALIEGAVTEHKEKIEAYKKSLAEFQKVKERNRIKRK